MNKYFFPLFFTCLLFFGSCKNKSSVSKPIRHFYHSGWKYYDITINDTLITGYEYNLYFRSKDSISGTLIDNKITWTQIDLSNNVSSNSNLGRFFSDKLEILLFSMYSSKDTVVLTPITMKEFKHKIDSTFYPKLTERQKSITLDEYILDIKIKDWNYQDGTGKTEVHIKDRKTNVLIQIIKSDKFIFNSDIAGVDYSDMNFDNKKDLMFYIGNLGNKQSPMSYYYLYNDNTKQFEYNEYLSENIMSGVGSSVNAKEKTITRYSTGSCCTHYADKYKVQGNKFTHIKKMLVEHTGLSDREVVVTTENLVNGKWIKKEKIYTEKQADKIDFYKNF